ncbi:MAG: diacylglycerol kinase family lipid kinase [Armatimonadetes bacterium]|nr:diacylglycerol kinase family lipid kinase [Armatimonadota bacterium]
MRMRAHAIVNPVAGRNRGAQAWARAKPVLESAGWEVTESFSLRQGYAVELAATSDAEVILAVGGDGTAHEVANGLLRRSRRPVMGVLPVGTGNDFARALGLPRDPAAAAGMLLTARPKLIDVGVVNDRCFLTVAGAGFDGEVAGQVNAWPKVLGGTAMYVLGILKMLVTYRPVEVGIVIDGVADRERLFLIAVGNTAWNAGGMWMVPPARPDDGILHVVIAGPLSRIETLGVLPRVYSGRHLLHPKIRQAQGREIIVTSSTPLRVQADGETIGTLPATFRVHPGALEVLIPAV